MDFDEKDAELLKSRIEAWNKREGPRVGDFVIFPDGAFRRFTHDWGDDIQTTITRRIDTSFHMFKDGYLSFSGSLDPAIPKARLWLQKDMVREGLIWFFHHDIAGESRGVNAKIPCRVYQYRKDVACPHTDNGFHSDVHLHYPGQWENEEGPKEWYALGCDYCGIFAYALTENDAIDILRLLSGDEEKVAS